MPHHTHSSEEHYLEVMESRSRVFRKMYDTIIEVESADEQQIYEIVCRNLLEICEAQGCALAAYDPATNTLTLKTSQTQEAPTRETDKKSIPLGPELKTLLLSQVLVECQESEPLAQLGELFQDVFGPCREDVHAAFTCVQGDELLAVGVLQMKSDQRLRMKDLIESYLKLAGIIIQRNNALQTLEQQALQLEEWNRELKNRVDTQVAELQAMGKLKRFLSPQVAELIINSENESALNSHRRNITVVFCDLRGFTAFSETAEPEDVIQVLREYHELIGPLVFEYEGAIDSFLGDGMMAFFNDPVPCSEPSRRAVEMAKEMRRRVQAQSQKWEKLGFHLGFGIGIAEGYTTMGIVGFKDRIEYSAIGSIPNLSARLCSHAKDGQILVNSRVAASLEGIMEPEPIGELELKGFHKPVPAFNIP